LPKFSTQICRVHQQMQSYPTSVKKYFSGDSKFSFSLGLRLIFFCVLMILLLEKSSKLAFLGIYFLISLFAFSMAPFC